MIQKRFDDIEKGDIEGLHKNSVPEGRTIDYKQELPGNLDRDKKEFLADVSSFANAAGGDVIFGVVEEGGVPVEVPGLCVIDPDAEILRLEEIIRSGIAPRIPEPQTKAVNGFTKGPVLLMRIPNSWGPPHMVTFKGTSRFYTRSSAGKYPMDVTEIRTAFVLAEGLPERIRAFLDQRLGKIIARETPVPLKPDPVLVLHLLPLSAFISDALIDMADLSKEQVRFPPISIESLNKGYNPVCNRRFNLDGLVIFSGSRREGERSRDYCQVFRSGQVESVYADVVRKNDGTGLIPNPEYEGCMVNAVTDYLDALNQLGISPPVFCFVSMMGVKGARLAIRSAMFRGDTHPIDRDILTLPDVVFEDYAEPVPKMMKPVFDAFWNACGYARSFNYDEAGEWKPATGNRLQFPRS